MNNGERILNEIIKQSMIRVDGATEPVVFVWSATSTDQLDALVEQIVHERNLAWRETVEDLLEFVNPYDMSLNRRNADALKAIMERLNNLREESK